MLELCPGETLYLPMEFIDEETELPIDITDASILFTLKKDSRKDDNTLIVLEKTFTLDNPTNGLASVTFTPEETKDLEIRNYDYSVEIVSANNTLSNVRFEGIGPTGILQVQRDTHWS
jgi:hypothetical protein